MFLYSFKRIRNRYFGAFLMVQWFRLPLFNAGDEDSIPDWEAKILHAPGPKNWNIKQKQYCDKFNKDIKTFIMVPFKKILKKTKQLFYFSSICCFFVFFPPPPFTLKGTLSQFCSSQFLTHYFQYIMKSQLHGVYLIHSSISSNLTLSEEYPRRVEDMETEFSAHNCLEWWL